MIGRGIDKSKRLLFGNTRPRRHPRNRADELRREVESLDANRHLNTAPEDLKNYLAGKYRIEPIRLLRDQWYADTHETQVDVRYDPNRWIDDQEPSSHGAG